MWVVGSDRTGLGAGAIRDATGEGDVRLPMVTGSNNVGHLGEANALGTLTSSGPAAKTPVVLADVTGSPTPELVVVAAASDTRYYGSLGSWLGTVTDADAGFDWVGAGTGCRLLWMPSTALWAELS